MFGGLEEEWLTQREEQVQRPSIEAGPVSPGDQRAAPVMERRWGQRPAGENRYPHLFACVREYMQPRNEALLGWWLFLPLLESSRRAGTGLTAPQSFPPTGTAGCEHLVN